MNTIELNELSLSELIRIKKEIPKAIIKAKKNEKKALRKKIEALAFASGFKLSELFPKAMLKPKKIKATRRKVAPKYRNPENTEQTWTGRGRRPKWIEDCLSKYDSLDSVAI